MEGRYRDFSEYFALCFPDFKVQKISVDAGFTCPNRDGTCGRGGCTYCNNASFSPGYTGQRKSVTEQLAEGIRFFSHKYPRMKYLAYFQSYTNTYGALGTVTALYEEALRVPGVVGLVIGTRPDCISPELLDYLEELSRHTFIYMEYGVESTDGETLLKINRGHSYEVSRKAIQDTAARGIPVGVHLIIGLPGEKRSHFITHALRLSEEPITSLKLHQLQILRGTEMGRQLVQDPSQFQLLTPQEYLYIAGEIIQHLRPDIYIDRFVSQSPPELLLAPRWNMKNYHFTALLKKHLEEQDIRQGTLFEGR